MKHLKIILLVILLLIGVHNARKLTSIENSVEILKSINVMEVLEIIHTSISKQKSDNVKS